VGRKNGARKALQSNTPSALQGLRLTLIICFTFYHPLSKATHHKESLHLPGHPVTAVVLRTAIKQNTMFPEIQYQLVVLCYLSVG
jgi:hypothetical protein